VNSDRDGEGDANVVGAEGERIYGDLRVLRPMLGASLAFMNRISKECFEPSLCIVDERGDSG
jgi:hypothetical protein